MNLLNFVLLIPNDLKALGGSEQATLCTTSTTTPVALFAILEGIGVLLAWWEGRKKRVTFEGPSARTSLI